MKTKPIQHSLQKLCSYGITPNFLCIRTVKYPDMKILNKILPNIAKYWKKVKKSEKK